MNLRRRLDRAVVTSNGQVTIPGKVRKALRIAPGSRVEFIVEDGGVRMTLARKGSHSRVEDGPGILKYSGPRLPVSDMHGGVAMKKALRARR